MSRVLSQTECCNIGAALQHRDASTRCNALHKLLAGTSKGCICINDLAANVDVCIALLDWFNHHETPMMAEALGLVHEIVGNRQGRLSIISVGGIDFFRCMVEKGAISLHRLARSILKRLLGCNRTRLSGRCSATPNGIQRRNASRARGYHSIRKSVFLDELCAAVVAVKTSDDEALAAGLLDIERMVRRMKRMDQQLPSPICHRAFDNLLSLLLRPSCASGLLRTYMHLRKWLIMPLGRSIPSTNDDNREAWQLHCEKIFQASAVCIRTRLFPVSESSMISPHFHLLQTMRVLSLVAGECPQAARAMHLGIFLLSEGIATGWIDQEWCRRTLMENIKRCPPAVLLVSDDVLRNTQRAALPLVDDLWKFAHAASVSCEWCAAAAFTPDNMDTSSAAATIAGLFRHPMALYIPATANQAVKLMLDAGSVLSRIIDPSTPNSSINEWGELIRLALTHPTCKQLVATSIRTRLNDSSKCDGVVCSFRFHPELLLALSSTGQNVDLVWRLCIALMPWISNDEKLGAAVAAVACVPVRPIANNSGGTNRSGQHNKPIDNRFEVSRETLREAAELMDVVRTSKEDSGVAMALRHLTHSHASVRRLAFLALDSRLTPFLNSQNDVRDRDGQDPLGDAILAVSNARARNLSTAATTNAYDGHATSTSPGHGSEVPRLDDEDFGTKKLDDVPTLLETLASPGPDMSDVLWRSVVASLTSISRQAGFCSELARALQTENAVLRCANAILHFIASSPTGAVPGAGSHTEPHKCTGEDILSPLVRLLASLLRCVEVDDPDCWHACLFAVASVVRRPSMSKQFCHELHACVSNLLLDARTWLSYYTRTSRQPSNKLRISVDVSANEEGTFEHKTTSNKITATGSSIELISMPRPLAWWPDRFVISEDYVEVKLVFESCLEAPQLAMTHQAAARSLVILVSDLVASSEGCERLNHLTRRINSSSLPDGLIAGLQMLKHRLVAGGAFESRGVEDDACEENYEAAAMVWLNDETIVTISPRCARQILLERHIHVCIAALGKLVPSRWSTSRVELGMALLSVASACLRCATKESSELASYRGHCNGGNGADVGGEWVVSCSKLAEAVTIGVVIPLASQIREQSHNMPGIHHHCHESFALLLEDATDLLAECSSQVQASLNHDMQWNPSSHGAWRMLAGSASTYELFTFAVSLGGAGNCVFYESAARLLVGAVLATGVPHTQQGNNRGDVDSVDHQGCLAATMSAITSVTLEARTAAATAAVTDLVRLNSQFQQANDTRSTDQDANRCYRLAADVCLALGLTIPGFAQEWLSQPLHQPNNKAAFADRDPTFFSILWKSCTGPGADHPPRCADNNRLLMLTAVALAESSTEPLLSVTDHVGAETTTLLPAAQQAANTIDEAALSRLLAIAGDVGVPQETRIAALEVVCQTSILVDTQILGAPAARWIDRLINMPIASCSTGRRKASSQTVKQQYHDQGRYLQREFTSVIKFLRALADVGIDSAIEALGKNAGHHDGGDEPRSCGSMSPRNAGLQVVEAAVDNLRSALANSCLRSKRLAQGATNEAESPQGAGESCDLIAPPWSLSKTISSSHTISILSLASQVVSTIGGVSSFLSSHGVAGTRFDVQACSFSERALRSSFDDRVAYDIVRCGLSLGNSTPAASNTALLNLSWRCIAGAMACIICIGGHLDFGLIEGILRMAANLEGPQATAMVANATEVCREPSSSRTYSLNGCSIRDAVWAREAAMVMLSSICRRTVGNSRVAVPLKSFLMTGSARKCGESTATDCSLAPQSLKATPGKVIPDGMSTMSMRSEDDFVAYCIAPHESKAKLTLNCNATRLSRIWSLVRDIGRTVSPGVCDKPEYPTDSDEPPSLAMVARDCLLHLALLRHPELARSTFVSSTELRDLVQTVARAADCRPDARRAEAVHSAVCLLINLSWSHTPTKEALHIEHGLSRTLVAVCRAIETSLASAKGRQTPHPHFSPTLAALIFDLAYNSCAGDASIAIHRIASRSYCTLLAHNRSSSPRSKTTRDVEDNGTDHDGLSTQVRCSSLHRCLVDALRWQDESSDIWGVNILATRDKSVSWGCPIHCLRVLLRSSVGRSHAQTQGFARFAVDLARTRLHKARSCSDGKVVGARLSGAIPPLTYVEALTMHSGPAEAAVSAGTISLVIECLDAYKEGGPCRQAHTLRHIALRVVHNLAHHLRPRRHVIAEDALLELVRASVCSSWASIDERQLFWEATAIGSATLVALAEASERAKAALVGNNLAEHVAKSIDLVRTELATNYIDISARPHTAISGMQTDGNTSPTDSTRLTALDRLETLDRLVRQALARNSTHVLPS